MIISKELKIKLNNKNISSIKNMGYTGELKYNDFINLDIKYLPLQSHTKILVKCYNCSYEKEIIYQSYNKTTKNNSESYFCNKKECINKKRNISIKKKYGVDNVFQLNYIKEKIKSSNLEKYGVENPQQNKEIKEKTENTNMEKYGFKNVFQNENIKNKIKKTNIRKYGVEYPQQSSKIRTKSEYIINTSKSEIEIFNFIKENYNGDILTNKRNIIIGLELDIYLPDLNLAFEFNGLYWHNEVSKPNNYHKNKTDLCLEKGIQLIHIYEDDWDYKKDVVKSMILNKLGKNTNKIFARKCQIKEIDDNKLIRYFLDKNHIQGFISSKIKLGLFYKNELVSLMIFGRKRKNLNSKSSEGEYEMLRFCNKINTTVIGGASRLFKYFIRNYNPNNIVSYADRSYSNGNLYKQLEFELSHISEPNYYYIVDKKRKYRFGFRKDILVKQGFDPNKTEKQIMLERKIYRIYNSGNLVFIYES